MRLPRGVAPNKRAGGTATKVDPAGGRYPTIGGTISLIGHPVPPRGQLSQALNVTHRESTRMTTGAVRMVTLPTVEATRSSTFRPDRKGSDLLVDGHRVSLSTESESEAGASIPWTEHPDLRRVRLQSGPYVMKYNDGRPAQSAEITTQVSRRQAIFSTAHLRGNL